MSKVDLEMGFEEQENMQSEPIQEAKSVKERLHAAPNRSSIFDAALVFEHTKVDYQSLIRALLNNGRVEFDTLVDSFSHLEHLEIAAKREAFLGRDQRYVFGFPMIDLPATEEAEAVHAPLVYFGISVEMSDQADVYRITLDQEFCELNEVVVNQLQVVHQCNIEQATETLSNGKGIDSNELLRILNSICTHLDQDLLSSCVELNAFDPHQSSGVQLSGVVQLLASFNLKSTERWKSIQRALPKKKSIERSQQVLPIQEYDPTQFGAMQNAFDRPLLQILGIAGTGKTRLAAGIATNAILEGKRVLYIHPQVRGLTAFKNELAECGVSAHAMTFDGHVEMQKRIADAVRLRPGLIKRAKAGQEKKPPITFSRFVEQYNASRVGLTKFHQSLRTRLFGDERMTDVTGRFLFAHLKEGRQLLAGSVKHIVLEFTPLEFDQIAKSIQAARRPYEALGTIYHPLRGLHSRFFEQHEIELELLNQNISARLEFYQTQIQSLIQRGGNLLDRYEQRLKDVQSSFYYRQKETLQNLEIDAVEFTKLYKNDFDRPNGFSNTIQSIVRPFSKKRKQSREERKRFLIRFSDFLKSHQRAFFASSSIVTETASIEECRTYLAKYKEQIEHWNSQYSSTIQEDIDQLSPTTCRSFIAQFESEVKIFDESYQKLIQELDTEQLLSTLVRSSARTVKDCIENCRKVEETLNSLHFHMRDFEQFQPWQSIWISISPQAQEIIKGLVKSNPNSWSTAFESWYFDRLLDTKSSTDFQPNPSSHSKAEQIEISLQRASAAYIQNKWNESFSTLKAEFKKFIQPQYEAQDVQTWLQEHSILLTTAFPISISTQKLSTTLLEELSFDIILVDDAHLIAESELSVLLNADQHTIFLSDPVAIQNNTHSVAAFLSDKQIPERYLEFSHLIESPHVIAPFAHTLTTIPTLLSPSIGTAQQKNVYVKQQATTTLELGIQEDEARQVIKWLFNLHEQEGAVYSTGQMPKVGICCLTENQRNFITSKLREAAQSNHTFQEQLIAFEKNGLQVFSLEDVPAERFQVMIVSCVLDDAQINNLDPKNQAHLASALQRTSSRIYLTHSLSDAWVEQHLVSPVMAHRILATCISYYSAISLGDKSKALQLVNRHASLRQDDSGSNLAIALKQAIEPYLPTDARVTMNYEYQDLTFDLLVEIPNAQQKVVVQLDSATRHWASPHFGWAQKRQAFIETLGYAYLEVYSYDLWQKPDDTIRRLARDIRAQAAM